MAVSRDVLKEVIFADSPHNWLIHSCGFYHAGCQLVGVVMRNEEQFPKIITNEMSFHHRYSYKIAVYLLSHAIELLLKASVSYYNSNNATSSLTKAAEYSHNAKKMFGALVKVEYIQKLDNDDEIIDLIDTYLNWFGRYFRPNEKQIDKVLENDYVKDENGLLEFKHDLSGAHKKLIGFYERIRSAIKVGNLFFHYSFQVP